MKIISPFRLLTVGNLCPTGLATAISTLPPPSEPLSLYLRWGGSIYFMMQGVAIVLEGVFEAVTGRRVGGRLGTLWMCLFVVTLGQALRDSWYVFPLASTQASSRQRVLLLTMCRRRQDPARSLARSPARRVLVVAAVRDTDGVFATSAALDELAPRILLRRAGTRDLPVVSEMGISVLFPPSLFMHIRNKHVRSL